MTGDDDANDHYPNIRGAKPADVIAAIRLTEAQAVTSGVAAVVLDKSSGEITAMADAGELKWFDREQRILDAAYFVEYLEARL